jgi:hypothetical protein
MNKITPKLLQELRQEINHILTPIAKKYHIELHLGNASYNESSFKFKLEGGLKRTNGLSLEENKYKDDLEKCAYLYASIRNPDLHLKSTDYGITFYDRNKMYTFIGLSLSRPKYPIVCKDSDGKIVLFTESCIDDIIKNRGNKVNNNSVVPNKTPNSSSVKMSDIINPLLIAGKDPEKIADKVIEQFPEKKSERDALIRQIKGPRRLNLIKAGKIKIN